MTYVFRISFEQQLHQPAEAQAEAEPEQPAKKQAEAEPEQLVQQQHEESSDEEDEDIVCLASSSFVCHFNETPDHTVGRGEAICNDC